MILVVIQEGSILLLVDLSFDHMDVRVDILANQFKSADSLLKVCFECAQGLHELLLVEEHLVHVFGFELLERLV